ncbi:histidine phosphatase family protein [Candidatus Spongiihabitans sp.]|uniref:histidine phosphatase family protein n=1 Tax=Candidatus Spongiihabitans sp. TaxID=3101308 RepID=UPI003C7E4B7D
MMHILFLRHGITEWNIQKKLQGRTDIALADAGKSQVLSWNIPADITQWYVSPLMRARQTAELLGLKDCLVCPALIEMNWGDWEGKTLDDLRKINASAMLENEDQGLDLQPPGGETPRQVGQRVHQWMLALPEQAYIGAITHKGVIRAVLSLATDWDMKTRHKVKIRHDTGYLFSWAAGKLEFKKEIVLCR